MAEETGPKGRVTISDVARHAGVSIGTVSRALNDVRNVRPDLQARVIAAAQALGYAADPVARSMRSRRSRAVGVVVPDFQNPLTAAAVTGVEEELAERGFTLLLASSRYDVGREAQILGEFERRRVDGVVGMVARDQDRDCVDRLRRLSIPFVLLEREIGEEFDAVRTDQVAGTYCAARYLIALGHERVGLVTVPQTNMSGRHRLLGFRKAFEDTAIPFPADLVHTDSFGRAHALESVYATLIARPRATALLVSGGFLGCALEAAGQLSLAIPAKLSLITLGDTELAAVNRPGITAVGYDWAKTGRRAARLLTERIDGRSDPTIREVIPYDIVMRASCAERVPALVHAGVTRTNP